MQSVLSAKNKKNNLFSKNKIWQTNDSVPRRLRLFVYVRVFALKNRRREITINLRLSASARGATTSREVGRRSEEERPTSGVRQGYIYQMLMELFIQIKGKGKFGQCRTGRETREFRPKYESDQGRSGIEVLKLKQSFLRNSSILLTSTSVKSCLETASYFLSCSCSWRSHIFPPVKPT